MSKDSYKKRMKGDYNQGKSCKGDGEERMYAKAEIRQFLKEMDEDYLEPYKKSKRKRNDKARLEHAIKWYEQALARHRHNDAFSNWLRHELAKSKKLYQTKYGNNDNEQ